MDLRIGRRSFLGMTGALFFSSSVRQLGASGGSEPPSVRFGLVTDSHYADRDPVGTRYYRESLTKMQEAVRFMNTLALDFVTHLGDFKDEAAVPNEQTTLEFLKTLEAAFAGFNGPRYHVLGNHDVDSISKQQFVAHVKNGLAKPAPRYSFDVNSVHFVVLDANFRSDGVAYNKGNFQWDDSFMPGHELEWLRKDLSDAKYPTIVFVHQLLDDLDDLEFCVKNAGEVRAILEQSKKVKAVFQGHVHKSRYHHINGIDYCSLPGMVDFTGKGNNSFSVVELYPSGGIRMTGYQRAPSRIME